MKRLLKQWLRRAGYEVKPVAGADSIQPNRADISPREWQIYSRVRDFTMVSVERILANIRAVDYILANGIAGTFVECGVWRGGSSMAMALALNESSRMLWLYDTFAGMTAATEADVSNTGLKASDFLEQDTQKDLLVCPLQEVRRNMQSTGYPMDRVRFVQGPVERTIPNEIPDRIALLRIDTDWYQSTRHELQHLYPRLSSGGVLLIDDYGHWNGAQRAVDEYFQGRLFLSRIDYTGRLAIKP